MHTLTIRGRGSGEKVKLFRVPTGTAISLVANGVAKFTDTRTQKEVRKMIAAITNKNRKQ
jgi:hypothetical protein